MVLFFLVLTKISVASSLELDSNSFRMLVLRSEYIAIGHVVEVHLSKDTDPGVSPTGVLKIKIVEALHGTLMDGVIDVPFDPDLTAISEPEYPVGAQVLCFLKKDPEGKYYSLESTGGARALAEGEFVVYKDRIKEMKQIGTIADEYKKFMETIEWLVKGLEHEATRFEMTFEFGDFIRHYSRPELSLENLLSEHQKLRLKKVLLETKETEPCNFNLVDLLYADYKTEIRPFLIQRLKTAQGYELWYAGEYMRLILEGKDSSQMKKIITDFMEVGFRRSKENELRTLANEFVVLAEKY